jgi:hypothetical protein
MAVKANVKLDRLKGAAAPFFYCFRLDRNRGLNRSTVSATLIVRKRVVFLFLTKQEALFSSPLEPSRQGYTYPARSPLPIGA